MIGKWRVFNSGGYQPMTELDRQVKEYKIACDAGRKTSLPDALWLLNELVSERDAIRKACSDLEKAVMLAVLNIDCERNGLTPDGNVRERLVSVLNSNGREECPCTFVSVDGAAACGVHNVNMRHTSSGWTCPISAWTFPFGSALNYEQRT